MQLVAQNLATMRGGRKIFQDLHFRIKQGEALLLTGANGSGKTTLIRTIAGFLAPCEGSLTLEGAQTDRPICEYCHYIGHLNAVKAKLTVEENLSFWANFLASDLNDAAGSSSHQRASALPPSTRLATAMSRFGLTALRDIPGGYLSAGQKRRLGLARLLLADRPLWLLDEPSVSLDSASVTILAQIVDEHVAHGGMAIAATHLPLGLKTTYELRLGVRQETPAP